MVQIVNVAGRPGNIDVRYGFPLGGDLLDIVAVNDRTNDRLLVYRVDAGTRALTRIDGNNLSIGANYGLGLYHSPVTGAFHVFVTTESGQIRQYELFDSGGQVARSQVRSWSFGGQTEGCVCDDETGEAYFGEEDEGIWKVGAEPDDPTSATEVASVGDGSGLSADVEGLTIYYAGGGDGYLIASSQGNDRFIVYERTPPHDPVLSFDVAGVGNADGIDVTNVPLSPAFPFGLFATHDDTQSPKPIQVCAYEDLGLIVDPDYWQPRRGSPLAAPVLPGAGVARVECYPSPFRRETRIRFALQGPVAVALDVLDVGGRRVTRLLDGRALAAGPHELEWNGRDASGRSVGPGVYFLRLRTGERDGRIDATGRVTLLR